MANQAQGKNCAKINSHPISLQKVCYGYLLEVSRTGASVEHPQHNYVFFAKQYEETLLFWLRTSAT